MLRSAPESSASEGGSVSTAVELVAGLPSDSQGGEGNVMLQVICKVSFCTSCRNSTIKDKNVRYAGDMQ